MTTTETKTIEETITDLTMGMEENDKDTAKTHDKKPQQYVIFSTCKQQLF